MPNNEEVFCYLLFDMFICDMQDQGILGAPLNPKYTEAGYILSLGVRAPHRRKGVATLLLNQLINCLMADEHRHCQAIFLHVLTTNTPAIRFYERCNFR